MPERDGVKDGTTPLVGRKMKFSFIGKIGREGVAGSRWEVGIWGGLGMSRGNLGQEFLLHH